MEMYLFVLGLHGVLMHQLKLDSKYLVPNMLCMGLNHKLICVCKRIMVTSVEVFYYDCAEVWSLCFGFTQCSIVLLCQCSEESLFTSYFSHALHLVIIVIHSLSIFLSTPVNLLGNTNS